MKAYEFITEHFLNEAPGPDYNNPSSVREWIERLERIIRDSDFMGERDNARQLLDTILAKIGKPKSKTEPKDDKPHNTDTSSSAFKVVFFGHFYDSEIGKRGSDKVWGWGVKDDIIFQFWGANGKTPQTKQMPNTSLTRQKMNKLSQNKANKGYKKISSTEHVDWLKNVLKRDPKFKDM